MACRQAFGCKHTRQEHVTTALSQEHTCRLDYHSVHINSRVGLVSGTALDTNQKIHADLNFPARLGLPHFAC